MPNHRGPHPGPRSTVALDAETGEGFDIPICASRRDPGTEKTGCQGDEQEREAVMSERTAVVVEIIKYPILIFSILLALVAAKHMLGLEFGVVTEVGTGGVKFAEKTQATFEALTNLEAKVNQAIIQIEQLKKDSNSTLESPAVQAKIFEAAQTVSDQTAKIEQIQLPNSARQARLKGYIWIGNFNGSWKKANLAQLDTGQPITLGPDKLQRGTEYTVLGNMVVRDGLPGNDQNYFKGRNSLGVVPSGTRVRIASEPVAIDREYAIQYWAEVEML